MPGGKRLEMLALSSPVGVELVRHPSAVQWLPGGKTVPKRGPVDFSGVFVGSGRAMYFDCKENDGINVMPTSPVTFPEHQRLELVRLGRAGAVSGLLCLRSLVGELYFCDWTLLAIRRASISWSSMQWLGLASRPIPWRALLEAEKGGSK